MLVKMVGFAGKSELEYDKCWILPLSAPDSQNRRDRPNLRLASHRFHAHRQLENLSHWRFLLPPYSHFPRTPVFHQRQLANSSRRTQTEIFGATEGHSAVVSYAERECNFGTDSSIFDETRVEVRVFVVEWKYAGLVLFQQMAGSGNREKTVDWTARSGRRSSAYLQNIGLTTSLKRRTNDIDSINSRLTSSSRATQRSAEHQRFKKSNKNCLKPDLFAHLFNLCDKFYYWRPLFDSARTWLKVFLIRS